MVEVFVDEITEPLTDSTEVVEDVTKKYVYVYPGIDYDMITSRIGVGSRPVTIEDVQDLVDQGFTHIVNVAAEVKNEHIYKDFPELEVLNNPTSDFGFEYAYFFRQGGWEEDKPTEWFERTINFTLKALAEPHNKVYIHCFQGQHRSPGAVYGVLRAMGLDQEDSTYLLKTARPEVQLIYKHEAELAIKELYS